MMVSLIHSFGAAEQEYSWAQPIPEGVFDSYDVQLVAPLDENDPVPSCRNADEMCIRDSYK